MNCKNHPDRPAVGACVTCGHMVCEECKVEIDDKIHCKSCVSERFSKKRIIPRLYRSISDRKLAGVCGVDPGPLTLRELLWMAEARGREATAISCGLFL